MTKGERISYAIDKEMCRDSLVYLLKTWNIEMEDYKKFLEAGRNSLPEEQKDE